MRARGRLLTPHGTGAIGVVAVGGAGAADLLAALGADPLPGPGTFGLRRLEVGPGVREDAVVVGREDGWEVHLHGNPLLADGLLERCDAGAAPVPRDLREEVLAAATRARTRLGVVLCLAQLDRGGLCGLADDVRAAPTEARRIERCRAALAAGASLQPLFEPMRAVLRGATNAGKSTLFNLLIGRERARTGAERALTREHVEEETAFSGWPVRLVDTAGEGASPTALNRRAIRGAREVAAAAHLTVWVAATTEPTEPDAAGPTIRIWTHGDRAPVPPGNEDELVLDLRAGEPSAQRETVGAALLAALRVRLPEPGAAWVTRRQERALAATLAAYENGDPAAAERGLAELERPDG